MSGEATRVEEIRPPHTHLALSALRELRPGQDDDAELIRQVDEVLRPAGYRLVGVFEGDASAVAIAGFREAHNLAWGHHIYVDDLSTVASARGRGHAGALLEWVREEALRLGCGQVHLDSGVGLDRADAHRLYLRSGFVISSHHFARRAAD